MSKKQVIFSDGKRKTFEKIIKQQTAEKKRELNRSLDNKVDGLFSKKYPLFLKDIKVKKDLDILKKASEQLDAFERELQTKKERLKDAVNVACKKLETICERQSKINGWDTSFTYGYDDFSDFNGKLENICREEITKQLRKSTKEGQELDAIDNRVDNLLLTLSYPNLMADPVDFNKALENGGQMLAIALNPKTLNQIEGS
jgi:hypothetical protein